MNRWETFQAFLSNQSVEISIPAFLVNLAMAAALAYLLGRVYVRYSRAPSNRRAFAANFMLLSMTTTLIISIVKSSLALSLGLVGALSIVRFRAAIKEPEELAYLFLAIAIGLGLGADQRLITVAAFAAIVPVLMIKEAVWKVSEQPNLYLTISSHSPGRLGLDQIVQILERHCAAVNLKRFDEDGETLEAAFEVSYENFDQVNQTRAALQAAGEGIRVSFLDNRGSV